MRRLTCILFADIVGYTSMMHQNESQGLQAVATFRKVFKPLVSDHGGTWHKELGDGVLCSFDSVVHALSAARDAQQRIQSQASLAVRIGIHLGDVTIQDNDIYGDGVNIASRIQSLAEPGSVYLTTGVFENARNQGDFAFAPLGYRRIKGLPSPLYLYRLETGTHQTDEKSRPEAERKSIVVLPFVDMSQHRDKEYFCDGMAEELINMLSKIRGLNVIARTSAFSFKDQHLDVREIAGQLGVDFLLEGSVRASGNKLRVTVQLISAQEGVQVWSERFDREMTDIFAIQDEISLKVLKSLEVKLFAGETSQLTKRSTENIEAYENYLLGRHHYNKFSIFSSAPAIEAFAKAIQVDPNFSRAYAGLADVYGQIGYWGFDHPKHTAPKVEANARKGLAIDPMSGDASNILANYLFVYLRDWDQARIQFQKSVDLHPENADSQFRYAIFLASMGQLDEAAARLDVAEGIDPLSILIPSARSIIQTAAGDLPAAEQTCWAAIEVQPDFPIAHWMLWRIRSMQERYEEALHHCRRVFPLWGTPKVQEFLDEGFATGGYRAAMLHAGKGMEELTKVRYVAPYDIALFYLHGGHLEKAIHWLEEGRQVGDPRLHFLGIDYDLLPLRHLPAFKEILRRMDLTQIMHRS